jgi:hypothetical protein
MAETKEMRAARETAHVMAKSAMHGLPPEAHKPLDRDSLVQLGKTLWPLSYQHTQNDYKAFELLSEYFIEQLKAEDMLTASVAASFLYLPMEQITMCWAARWADQAFPVFQMGHKYASALMATSVTVAVEDIQPPFRAFMIEMPDKLLIIEDPVEKKMHDVRYVTAHYGHTTEGESVWTVAAICGKSSISLWRHGLKTKDMLEEDTESTVDWASYSFGLPIEERDSRIHFLLQRLVINTCLAVSNKENLKPIGKTKSFGPSEMRRAGEPLVRTFQVGKPLQLDCRQGVHDYIEGVKRGHKLSVQTLVTGHWKRQPYGPQSSLRKIIWREPFWRGPEDAPILARPKQLGKE